MTWTTFLLAVLKALPAAIQLVASIKEAADAAVNRGIGHDQAVSEALSAAHEKIAIAKQVDDDAARDHAAHADDTAFDQEFRRP